MAAQYESVYWQQGLYVVSADKSNFTQLLTDDINSREVAPPASVGGTTAFLTSGSRSPTGSFAPLAGGVAAVVAITAGGWYTRRRWLGDRS